MIALPCLVYAMGPTVRNLAVRTSAPTYSPAAPRFCDRGHLRLPGRWATGHHGTLGDRVGRRRLLLIGAAAFGIASVLAAYSRSSEQLIAARALLGVAGGTLAPSTCR